MSISHGHIMSIIAAVAASPALVNIASVVDPHVAAGTGTAVRPPDTSEVPAVAADTLPHKVGKVGKANRADKVAEMVVVVDDT